MARTRISVDFVTQATLPARLFAGKVEAQNALGEAAGGGDNSRVRTSNPALGNDTFTADRTLAGGVPMTIQGTVQKSTLLLALCVGAASFTWQNPHPTALLGGAIGGFIVAIVLTFKKTWAPGLAPLYALLQGLFLGALSRMYEGRFEGIVFQAVGLTFGTMFALLGAYQTGLIKATENFKLGVVAATGGIAIVYLVTMVLGFCGVQVPFIHEGGWFGIGFSCFVVVIAALNLVLDFDFIEQGAAVGAPKYLEWYAAFGLLVTLVWLYIEILRLLSKLRSR